MQVLESPATVSPANNDTGVALRKGTLRLSNSRNIAAPADVAGSSTEQKAPDMNATATQHEKTEEELLAEFEEAEKIAQTKRDALAAHRNSKRGDVLARLRNDIKTYGFTAKELGVGSGTTATPSKLPKEPKGDAAPRVKSDKSTHPYKGPNEGETWAGRGKHPDWLTREINVNKRTKEDFKV